MYNDWRYAVLECTAVHGGTRVPPVGTAVAVHGGTRVPPAGTAVLGGQSLFGVYQGCTSYEVVRYLTRVRGTLVLVDTPLGIQLTRVSCTCSAFALSYV